MRIIERITVSVLIWHLLVLVGDVSPFFSLQEKFVFLSSLSKVRRQCASNESLYLTIFLLSFRKLEQVTSVAKLQLVEKQRDDRLTLSHLSPAFLLLGVC
jgi:hypothetical protein